MVFGIGWRPQASNAQEIKYFPRGVKSDQLIDALKPRGIQAVPAKEAGAKPQCEKYRPQGTRGITPVSDIAGIEVLFAFNSDELTPEARQTLTELGKALTSDDLKRYCFVVEGHTDNVGSDQYNQALSERRARSATRFLATSFTIDPARLVVTGYGKTHPIADNNTDEGRQKNRRVQVANVGE
jgi:outer membrane protein OmpA-like peptidoglycan-associated protein